MATTTTHYSLKKYEGADLFNPLTYENANADAIDQAMYDNKQQAVGSATELAVGTVHALTRGNTDSPIFAFTATSNFAEGDTFTVDGTPVTALTTSGETLPGGAYVIGAEVIGFLRSTQLTLFVYKKPASTIAAGNVTYNNASSGLTATDAQAAIDEMDEYLEYDTPSLNVDLTALPFSNIVSAFNQINVSKSGKTMYMGLSITFDDYVVPSNCIIQASSAIPSDANIAPSIYPYLSFPARVQYSDYVYAPAYVAINATTFQLVLPRSGSIRQITLAGTHTVL